MTVKRLIDIFGALIGLIFTGLIFPFVWLAVKIEDGGRAIIKLDRISRGQVIKVFKFRSMIEGAHKLKPQLSHLNERGDGPFFKIKNDPRITKVGRVIRKFRLDEFPQFWNVLKGEMSLVGPRPHEPEEVKRYPPEFRKLSLAKAGITGWSQINGASSLPFLKELELDDYYLKHQSLWLDLKIIFKTISVLFVDPTAV